MKITLLGGEDANANQLASRVKEAAAELELDYEFKWITDPTEISSDAVAQIAPVLLIDGEIKVSGEAEIPEVDELKKLLQGQ